MSTLAINVEHRQAGASGSLSLSTRESVDHIGASVFRFFSLWLAAGVIIHRDPFTRRPDMHREYEDAFFFSGSCTVGFNKWASPSFRAT